jgi:hypothetical protein
MRYIDALSRRIFRESGASYMQQHTSPEDQGWESSARRSSLQKTTGMESPPCNHGGGDRRERGGLHRSPGTAAVALQCLPSAMREGAWLGKAARVAGSGLSGPAPQVALPPTTSGLPALRSTCGRPSLSRTVGARDQGMPWRGWGGS